MNISKSEFGKVDGETVYLFTLENDKGMKTSISNYGGIMNTLFVPDRNGKAEDVVLGFDNLADYLKEYPYFGCLVGRYGNRIAKGSFKLDNVTYKLAINNGPNHLHGGLKGFDKVIWSVQELRKTDEVGIKLSYLSKDMEEGYPGNLSVEVIYSLTNSNELKMEYFASTDKKTVLNLTQHNYYNLTACKTDVKEHLLTMNTGKVVVVDEGSIPTGEILDVAGTPFDFQIAKKIGKDLDASGGYDHNFILNQYDGSLKMIARAEEPVSGRVMEVLTTQPGTQLYTANYLDGTFTGKGINYKKHYGFCLETQHYPDSPNRPEFPITTLEPGQKYHQLSVFKFSVK
jgi:aldose 1-epimerase